MRRLTFFGVPLLVAVAAFASVTTMAAAAEFNWKVDGTPLKPGQTSRVVLTAAHVIFDDVAPMGQSVSGCTVSDTGTLTGGPSATAIFAKAKITDCHVEGEPEGKVKASLAFTSDCGHDENDETKPPTWTFPKCSADLSISLGKGKTKTKIEATGGIDANLLETTGHGALLIEFPASPLPEWSLTYEGRLVGMAGTLEMTPKKGGTLEVTEA